MTRKNKNAFEFDLLAHAERLDLLDKRGAYNLKLDSVKMMQSLDIDDAVIETLLNVKLHPQHQKIKEK